MFSYIFVLGKATDLCTQELETVLSQKNLVFKTLYSSDQIYHLEAENQIEKILMLELGGVIKMARVFGQFDVTVNLTTLIADYLRKTSVNKVTFGLSLYGQNKSLGRNLLAMAKEIKKNLTKDLHSCRFVLGKEDNVLSSVQITKQKVTEIIISCENDKLILAGTETVQDFEDWNKRDYSRPQSDPKSGMLPPKVARMMVNIGRSKISAFVRLSRTSADKDDRGLNQKILLDPFCGMGTILQEGLNLGFKVIGSDQDEQVVLKAKKNLEWFCKEYQVLSSKYQVLRARAEQISQKLPSGFLVDAIVTEPYLGPNREPKTGIEDIIDGLSRLYLGCFNDWKKILKDNGLIVIAFPSFFIKGREHFVSRAIDKIAILGYSIETGPLPYFRPQALVRRNIYVLKKYGTHQSRRSY